MKVTLMCYLRLFILSISLLALSGCGGSSSGNSDNNNQVTPQENRPQELTDEELQSIISAIEERTQADGASYLFDQMEPIIDVLNDSVSVHFVYLDTNTIGGSPIVEYSRSSSEITSISYTR